MSKLQAIICVGTSASGKSTFTKTLDNSWIISERDIHREHILVNIKRLCKPTDNIFQFWKFKWENAVNVYEENDIKLSLDFNKNICFANTNLNKERRDALKLKLEALGYEVEIKVFGLDLSIDELWKRDTFRKNVVGHSIIAKQYEQFRKEFPKYILKDVANKDECVIFDIDGTLSHMNGRSPFEWMRVGEDVADELLFISMIAFFDCGYKIIIMSGRDSVCRDATKSWLIENAIKYGANCGFKFDLYMRVADDMRKDTIVKEELFFTHVDGNYKVKAVFDDRPAVCRTWMELGLRVIHCGNPYINF